MTSASDVDDGSERRSDTRPLPEPDDVSTFFWEGAKEGRLRLQRCSACGRFQYPPDVVCVHCQSSELVPTDVSGQGSLYSYTVVERPFHAGFVNALPYVVGLVELVEQKGVKMLTNIVEAPREDLMIGMPLEVTFESRGSVVLPQFRPRGRSS
jgi:uncharacterized OB-fold protein